MTDEVSDTVSPVLVLGIGNTMMGDDGAGVQAVRGLARSLPAGAAAVLAGTACMPYVSRIAAAQMVIAVDAVEAGSPAGTLFRFDPDAAGVLAARADTAHAIGFAHALTSARLMGARPEAVMFGVQVGAMQDPDTLSPAVAAAIPRLRRLVAEEARRFLGT